MKNYIFSKLPILSFIISQYYVGRYKALMYTFILWKEEFHKVTNIAHMTIFTEYLTIIILVITETDAE